MARPKTKEELIQAAHVSFDKLLKLIDSMPEVALNQEFDFSSDAKKKEQHWARDKNLRDVLVHIYEWHLLLIKWVISNSEGNEANFIPEPYTWKTYGEMNVEFWKSHQNTKLESAKKMLRKSHSDLLELVQNFSDEQLFTKKYFGWTGTTSLGSYCISSTSSHYDWAIKKLRAHIKNAA